MMPTRATLVPVLLLLAACAGSAPEPATPPADTTAPSASAAPAPSTAEASATPDGRDPAVVALAKPALDCNFKNDSFDTMCPAYKAWNENDDLFRDGRSSPTVLSMLGDPDVKVRVLAVGRYIPKEFFADKAHARKLFALALTEKGMEVGRKLADYVAAVNAEDLGLADELRGLTKNPSAYFRAELAHRLIATRQTPLALEVGKALMDDPESDVRENAVDSLSFQGMTPATPPVCKLLTETLARPDDTSAYALAAGATSKCPGIKELVVAELAKRVGDPAKITIHTGGPYATTVSWVCREGASADTKKKAFALARKLTDTRVKESVVRYGALEGLMRCDPVAGKQALTALLKDKDKFVASQAKRLLPIAEKK